MNRSANRIRLSCFALAAALAAPALSGCTTSTGPGADIAASRAEAALTKGKHGKAVQLAEAAVAKDPRNAAYRTVLGNAYLGAGRFQSAAASYEDAMTLGDHGSRTALSLALAHIANANPVKAAAVLDDWRDTLAPGDLGLAYALAGQSERGVHVLSVALRSGENTPKIRQNLAYASALAGDWRQARLMAAQDIPADQIDQRISEWAQLAHPDAFRMRVASLLAVPAHAADPGQPAQLALSNYPGVEQLAAEAAARAPLSTASAPVQSELPPVASAGEAVQPQLSFTRYEAPLTTQPQSFEAAFAADASHGAAPAAPIASAARIVKTPGPQKMSARFAAASGRDGKAGLGPGERTHLVQLGSFASEEGAKRAWGLYTKRHPSLGQHGMKITQARLGGKTYWRVSAAGFSHDSAQALCARVKRTSTDGCIPYAAASPLPGAVD